MDRATYYATRTAYRRALREEHGKPTDPYRNTRQQEPEAGRRTPIQIMRSLEDRDLLAIVSFPAAESGRLTPGRRAQHLASWFPRLGPYAGKTMIHRVALRRALRGYGYPSRFTRADAVRLRERAEDEYRRRHLT